MDFEYFRQPYDFLSASHIATAGFWLVGTTLLYSVIQLLKSTKIDFYHGKDSVVFQTKAGDKTTFSNICKTITPKCRLNPFLFNGHFQTVWNNFRHHDVPIYYKRWVFEQQDLRYPGSFAVDFVSSLDGDSDLKSRAKTSPLSDEDFGKIGSKDSKPMLVVLHGLGGGSHERYLREAIAPLVTETAGWEACVVISRGCSRTKLTSNLLYHARSTWDLKQAVQWLHETFPNRPLYGLGFSLGANILTNYVADEGAECVLKAAVAISNPWDLEVSSLGLLRSWVGRNVYLRTLGTSLKTLFDKHAEKIMMTPGIDFEAVQKVRFLYEFDRAVQVPMWGYPTEWAYYRDASSVDPLLAVQIPFFAVNATDDPIAMAEAIPTQEFQVSPYTVLCTTSQGGHLGWFELGGQRWINKVVESFFQKMARDVGSEDALRPQSSSEDGPLYHEKAQAKLVFDPVRRKMP